MQQQELVKRGTHRNCAVSKRRINNLPTEGQLDNINLFHPKDQYNVDLEKKVRPPGWKNPSPTGRYNLVVIGAGTAGLVSAAGAAGIGAKVALIECSLMGGDCLNVGCVPSKAMISSARVAAAVAGANSFGISVSSDPTINFSHVMERLRRIRASIATNDSAARFRNLNVDVYLGQARFSGPDTIDVDGVSLQFKRAVIATGARASTPSIPGLEYVDYLTNETVFSLTELPRRLGVIGAGPIGCELAQAFAWLGAEAFLIESTHGVLPREDPDTAGIIKNSIERSGVKLFCCGKETELNKAVDGIHIKLKSHNRHYDVIVDKLLIAAGRAPNIEGLNLEAAGVRYDEKGIDVNDYLRTTNFRIYAAGDICSSYQFTHAADFMARIVIKNALFMGGSKTSALTIPWCTYTSPEIAHVGLSENDAGKKNIKIDTFIQKFKDVDRAVLDGESEGLVKIHCKKGKDKILGATIVATNAGDMISEITLAMTQGIGLKDIGNTIHPYPTQAEAIRKLGDQYNRTRLTPLVKWIMRKWLSWTR